MAAFPSESDLEIMLSDELDWKLNQIAGGSNYQQIVFNLINKYTEPQGKTIELLKAAKKANPGNTILREFNL